MNIQEGVFFNGYQTLTEYDMREAHASCPVDYIEGFVWYSGLVDISREYQLDHSNKTVKNTSAQVFKGGIIAMVVDGTSLSFELNAKRFDVLPPTTLYKKAKPDKVVMVVRYHNDRYQMVSTEIPRYMYEFFNVIYPRVKIQSIERNGFAIIYNCIILEGD
jgi:hypothetical protein